MDEKIRVDIQGFEGKRVEEEGKSAVPKPAERAV